MKRVRINYRRVRINFRRVRDRKSRKVAKATNLLSENCKLRKVQRLPAEISFYKLYIL